MSKETDLVFRDDTSVLTIENYETDLQFGRVIQNSVFGEFVSCQYSMNNNGMLFGQKSVQDNVHSRASLIFC